MSGSSTPAGPSPVDPPRAGLLRRMEPKIDVAATLAALAVIPLVVLEQSASSGAAQSLASAVNWAIWLLFLADALVKLALYRGRWLRTPGAWFSIAIVLLTFPLLGEVLATFRIARLGRVGRLTQLANLGRASRLGIGFTRAFVGLKRYLDPEALPYVSLLVAVVCVSGATALHVFEFGKNPAMDLLDAMWWAVVTVTTVGYGDISPVTNIGRLVATVVMLLGITFTSLLTAQIAAYLTRAGQQDLEQDLGAEIAALATQLESLATALQRIELGMAEGGRGPGRGPRSA